MSASDIESLRKALASSVTAGKTEVWMHSDTAAAVAQSSSESSAD